jgi:transketolase C-terminal domain/subunit
VRLVEKEDAAEGVVAVLLGLVVNAHVKTHAFIEDVSYLQLVSRLKVLQYFQEGDITDWCLKFPSVPDSHFKAT